MSHKHLFLKAIQLCVLSICLISLKAYSLQTDRDQPIKISSKKADLNDVVQEYFLTGDVVIIKGSLRIQGDKAVIVVDPEGYQKITVIASPNLLAKFSQKMDGPDNETTEGQGDLIFYDEKAESLLIKGRANAKKKSGSQLIDEINAESIDYALDTEKYKALSGQDKKVKTMIAPQKQKESVKLFDAK
jgi:lipopolysaccharide export system protein LptA